MSRPCFRAEEITERRRAKSSAPCRVRKPPEILIFTFIILRSCSARLLVKGTVKSVRKRRVASLKVLNRMTEQLAGDELVDWQRAASFTAETVSLLAATGFLRNVEDHTSEPQYGIEKRYEVVNEVMDMFSTSVLGLTMECCRCHNHKYDPLPQRDYYRLMACFEPALNPHDWKRPQDRFLADVSLPERAEIDRRNAEIDQQVAELQTAENATRQQVRQRVFDSRLASVPEPIRPDVKQALEVAADKRDAVQKYLAEKFQPTFNISDPDIDAALTEQERTGLADSAAAR